jgi:hypothetical protein
VEACLRGGSVVPRPWLVYTAGPMGAGAIRPHIAMHAANDMACDVRSASDKRLVTT